jgi:hydrogenase maturation protease
VIAAPLKLRVIGLGNPDRGDDGIGARVVQALDGRLADDVALQACRGDVLSLIDDWAGVHALVCIDAAESMGRPGRVHRFDLASDELSRGLSFASSHAMGLAEAIALARTLDLAPAHIVIYAIEGAGFDTGADLSAAVEAVANEVATQVIADIERLRHAIEENPSHA